ncbi:MAG: double-strand break repair helicase AddA [Nisaea sp.]|uniref:double-strand break repair helicase AddA n=1 Tax=Nisaea sp. TaxID=2024842 RepID=UPI001B21C5D1|nr:double-strand break repair helicase AddA [Nisaea sp.]MBO6559418.1 double-strand break repair helicase AddA [Nisaea sp.]
MAEHDPKAVIQEADRAQRRAADPAASVWVAASAGTGKTKVLTDRVLNLLLAGADPGRILCLTFTKAAAAEMSARISGKLSEWAVTGETVLIKKLEYLLGRQPKQNEIALARQLFARTLDTPGGLKIQTIHAFCQAVLKRFPLEAGLPPHFQVMDDRTAAERLWDARDRVLNMAAADPESVLGQALRLINRRFAEETFDGLVSELLQERARLARFIEAIGGKERIGAALRTHLDLPPEETAETVLRDGLADSALDLVGLRRAVEALVESSKTDMERGAALADFLTADGARRPELFESYCGVFLTGGGEMRKRLATKAAVEFFADIETVLAREGERLIALKERLNAHGLAERTSAVLRISAAVLDGYEAGKRRGALVDFEDLVATVCDLLKRPGVAAWVLFKLDGGLDHILIDEAQDTNPEQWEVVQALTEEFFAGEGAYEEARDAGRSIFAVGDVKQSIFSFQRADPEGFLRMRRHFAERVAAAAGTWASVDLEVSFRSGAAVLGLVDRLFNSRPAGEGVLEVGDDGELLSIRHGVSRGGDASLVEIWPPFLPAESEEEGSWALPLAQRGLDNPASRLAAAIAGRIRSWIERGEILPSKGRPIGPGDIMVLVRRRGGFVHEMVRALKERDIDVAGVDRMVLSDQIAVMDLIALGRFLLLPEDDLTLATVLKSPLIGFDEDELFELAWNRKEKRLWRELRRRAPEKASFARADQLLTSYLARTDTMPPYELFAGILAEGEPSGRRRILERLGIEAADPLDEFLAQALEYERGHVPSLQGFLHWLEASESDIKRDMEGGEGGRVRVMTVHGSKGLQAPIVFMPDTMQVPRGTAKILWSESDDGVPVPLCAPAKAEDAAASADAKEAAERKRNEEYRRLLYVAMTRAEDRLYVAGWATKQRAPEGNWYDLVRAAMGDLAAEVEDSTISAASGSDLPLLRHETAQEREVTPPAEVTSGTDARKPVPGWALSQPAPEPVPPRPLMPSRPSDPEPALRSPLSPVDQGRFKRGQLIHRMLQVLPDLPAERRREAGASFLARPLHDLAPEVAARYLDEVMAVLEHPDWAGLFAPASRAEVPIVGQVATGDGGITVVSGQIDRLLVEEARVTVVDFKTNRPPPERLEDVPAVYLKQMAAYRALLAGMFEAREVRCLLLWTDGPFLTELPPDLLDSYAPGAPAA